MLYINAKERAEIELFRSLIYAKLKADKLRYSDQRERVLKVLYRQNYPVSIDFLVNQLSEAGAKASYATIMRHIKFFEALELLIVVNKIPRGYLLKKSVESSQVEVLTQGIGFHKS